MPFEVLMPRLGWNMEKGTLVRWVKAEGEYVRAGEILFEVEADKATQEMEALESGVLHLPHGAPVPGSSVPVGTLLGYLLQEGESAPAAGVMVRDARPPEAVRADLIHPAPDALPPARALSWPERPAISPRARRVAHELGIEWETLRGSGRTGRIVERDVRLAASSAGVQVRPATVAPEAPPAGSPPIHMTIEADAAEFVRVSDALAGGQDGGSPARLDLLAVIVARALRDYPALNARREAGVAVTSGAVHLRVTVALEGRQATSVLRDVQRLTLAGVAQQSAALLAGDSPSDNSDATFNLMDLSRYHLSGFIPGITPPACATLVLAGIASRTERVGAAGKSTHAMYLSLAIERGLVEEGTAAGFLNRLRQLVEQPLLLLL